MRLIVVISTIGVLINVAILVLFYRYQVLFGAQSLTSMVWWTRICKVLVYNVDFLLVLLFGCIDVLIVALRRPFTLLRIFPKIIIKKRMSIHYGWFWWFEVAANWVDVWLTTEVPLANVYDLWIQNGMHPHLLIFCELVYWELISLFLHSKI